MGLYDRYEIDKNLENSGIWIDYGGDGRFLVARIGSGTSAYDKRLKYKMKPYRRQLDNDTLDENLLLKITTETFAETALMDWDGIRDREGNILPFSKENAKVLFADLPNLALDLMGQARDFQNYLLAQREDDAKN